MFSFEIQAQLKTVVPGNATKTSHQSITPPTSKLNITRSAKASGTFVPKTLDFVKNSENGLNVKTRSGVSQLPIFISGEPTLNLKEGNDSNARSYNFLENAKGLMGIQNPIDEFRIVKTDEDELGFTHVRLQQEIKGIPIYGSEVIYHYTDTESFLNGRYTETPILDTYKPSLGSKSIEAIAIEDVGGIMTIEEDKFGLFDFEKVTSELVIYEGRLAYHLSVYKNIIDLWEYFIDAHSGEIIHKHTSICKFHNFIFQSTCWHK